MRNASSASKPGPQPSLDVIHGVNEAAVHLDLPPADHRHAAGDADPRLVVAVHVGAHGQLGLFLERVEQRADVLGVPQRVGAAADGAGDRAGLHPVPGDPHVHLRGRADQALPLPQVEEELIRRRVALPQPFVERGRGRARAVEHVAGHHLEQVTAGEPLPGLLDDAGVAARFRRPGHVTRKPISHNVCWLATAPRPAGAAAGLGGGLPRPPLGGRAADGELVAVPDGLLPLAVKHVQLVGQVQDQVTLVIGAVVAERHRLELERQVVAERAVQAQVRVAAGERRDDLAECGEHGGPPAPVLLGHQARGLWNDHLDAARQALALHQAPGPQQGRAQDGEQHLAPGVQRPDSDPPAPGHDLDAGVHIGHVPAAVPARVLHAGTQHATAPVINLRADIVQGRRPERICGPGHPDAADGDEVRPLLLLMLCCRVHRGSLPHARCPANARSDRRCPGDRFWICANQDRLTGGATTGDCGWIA